MTTTTAAILITALCFVANPHGEGDEKKTGKKTDKNTTKISITLKADATARGTELRIGDVATVKSSDPELTARILGLEIGRPPQPGYTRVVSQNDVILRMMREGLAKRHIEFTGGTQSFVQPSVHHLSAAEVTKVAGQVLDRAILQSNHPDVTYKLRSSLSVQQIPVGRTSRELVARVQGGQLGNNHAQVSVDVMIDGNLYKTIQVYYSLKRFYKVLALAYGVEPGTMLSESNLEWQRIESLHGIDQYVTAFEQIRGKTARTRIRRGTILTHRHLGVQSLVRAGDIVDLVMDSGRVKVRTKVRALDAGHLGKFIRIIRLGGIGRNRRRVDTNSILVAKVASANSVVIDSH